MRLGTKAKRLIATGAALLTIPVVSVAAAQASQAADCNPGSNETVSKFGGTYKANFSHYGEKLKVEDHASDGYAAVAYVRIHAFQRCVIDIPKFASDPHDSDRFVTSIGEDTYNLGTPDGSGNLEEGERVQIMVCRGYASIPGDNCSDWESGVA